jgi:hypothetical protein
MRSRLARLLAKFPEKSWRNLFARAFSASLIALAMSASLMVSYYGGCNKRPYASVVSDPAYVRSKGAAQVSATLSSIAIGVTVWSVIILFSLIAIRRKALGKASLLDNADAPAADDSRN